MAPKKKSPVASQPYASIDSVPQSSLNPNTSSHAPAELTSSHHAFPIGQRWTVEVERDGCWKRKGAGLFRVTVGDIIEIIMPSGCDVNSNPTLKYIDPYEELRTAQGGSDSIGTWFCEWQATTSGPHTFYFEYDSAQKEGSKGKMRASSCHVAVLVEPQLTINGKPLPPSAIAMQTVLSRCLGKVPQWKRMLKSQSQLGYNMIHFTPLQELGESGSCYSLGNQCRLADDFFEGKNLDEETKLQDLEACVSSLERDLGLLSTTDLVLNHTAHNSQWIFDNPECGYNLENSPHLTGALELDNALADFSLALIAGKFEKTYGARAAINTEDDLNKVMAAVRAECLTKFKMGEWFTVDVAKCVQEFKSSNAHYDPNIGDRGKLLFEELMKKVGVRRNGVYGHGAVLKKLFKDEGELKRAIEGAQQGLWHKAGDTEGFIPMAIHGHARWERLEKRVGPIGKERWQMLTPNYFTKVECKKTGKTHYLANNGWVMGWDARQDFAAPGSIVYLKRDLVVWSDCIKLRYGRTPSDCPFLWDWMAQYCREAARCFHGVRLDNCHSTPIHVARYMLTEARKVRPHLWIYAELFTGSQDVDLEFESVLGLNALIREAMQTWNPKDLASLVMKYGGRPVGALDPRPASLPRTPEAPCPLVPSFITALFFDCTHDNDTPNQKRTPGDALPTAAVVAATACATGSTRGYDDLVPSNLSVVTERRLYNDPIADALEANGHATDEPEAELGSPAKKQPSSTTVGWTGEATKVVIRGEWDGWKSDVVLTNRGGKNWEVEMEIGEGKMLQMDKEYQYKYVIDGKWQHDGTKPTAKDSTGNVNNVVCTGSATPTPGKGGAEIGIHFAKKELNRIHVVMAQEGYTECYMEMKAEDVIVVQRHNPKTHKSYVFVIRSAFWWNEGDWHPNYEVMVDGKVSKVHLHACLFVPKNKVSSYRHNKERITGFDSPAYRLNNPDISLHGGQSKIFLRNWRPGSVLVVETEGYAGARKAVNLKIRELETIVAANVDLQMATCLLYSCEAEERDRTGGKRGVYDVPGHGQLVYAGFAGIIPVLNSIREWQSLDHALCHNLRGGNWLMDYLTSRLDTFPKLKPVQKWVSEAYGAVRDSVPRAVIPFYVDLIVASLFSAVRQHAFKGMAPFILESRDPFVRDLACATLQFYSYVPSAPVVWTQAPGGGSEYCPSLCAGLPHFSTGFMRNWGRDTMISIPGCLIATGRFDEARAELLGFARVCRHGLIPNLLDSGNCPRYNARDATWFFMQCVQDYCRLSPEGNKFLLAPVTLKWPPPPDCRNPANLGDLVYHILCEHAKGIDFREWNAGSKIDEHMQDEGFNVKVTMDPNSGMVYGGNKSNCGTWMDKMGSSAKASNKGVPATPRDGAAVEIIGLLKSCLRWVVTLGQDVFPYRTAQLGDGPGTQLPSSPRELTFVRWNSLIEARFEKTFYVPPVEEEGDYFVDPKLINKRGIYKDTHKATHPWCDYQLRPNVCVAMAVAPELFTRTNGLKCLEQIEKNLFTPSSLGLKTLDPSDSNYRPDYDNANDGTDKTVAHGWNYHQGPEWVWPLGYFLTAKLLFMREGGKPITQQMRRECTKLLLNHRDHVAKDVWMSLPEITNANGKYCPHSCPAQAWSVATLLAFLNHLSVGGGPGQPNDNRPKASAGGKSPKPIKGDVTPEYLDSTSF